jgi:hypothetical protein
MVASVNEKSEAFITAVHTDKAGAPVTPVSLRYRIDDVRSGNMIKDWTTIPIGSPGTEHEITVTDTENAIINTLLSVEQKIVTFETTSASGTRNDVIRYNVVNLKAVA